MRPSVLLRPCVALGNFSQRKPRTVNRKEIEGAEEEGGKVYVGRGAHEIRQTQVLLHFTVVLVSWTCSVTSKLVDAGQRAGAEAASGAAASGKGEDCWVRGLLGRR